MSVAIDNTVAAQVNKSAYDAEFDAATAAPTLEDEDFVGPAKMCWITCLITGI